MLYGFCSAGLMAFASSGEVQYQISCCMLLGASLGLLVSVFSSRSCKLYFQVLVCFEMGLCASLPMCLYLDTMPEIAAVPGQKVAVFKTAALRGGDTKSTTMSDWQSTSALATTTTSPKPGLRGGHRTTTSFSSSTFSFQYVVDLQGTVDGENGNATHASNSHTDEDSASGAHGAEADATRAEVPASQPEVDLLLSQASQKVAGGRGASSHHTLSQE